MYIDAKFNRTVAVPYSKTKLTTKIKLPKGQHFWARRIRIPDISRTSIILNDCDIWYNKI